MLSYVDIHGGSKNEIVYIYIIYILYTDTHKCIKSHHEIITNLDVQSIDGMFWVRQQFKSFTPRHSLLTTTATRVPWRVLATNSASDGTKRSAWQMAQHVGVVTRS